MSLVLLIVLPHPGLRRRSASRWWASSARSCRGWRRTRGAPGRCRPGSWRWSSWCCWCCLVVMPIASLLTWAERKQSAMMQDRIGPNRAAIGGLKLVGHHALRRRRAEDDHEGGLRPGQGQQVPLHAGADDGHRAGVRGVRHRPLRRRRLHRPAVERGARPGDVRPDRARCRWRGSTWACSSTSPSPRWPSTAPRWPAGRPTTSGRSSAACAPVADDVVRGHDGPGDPRHLPRLRHARAGRHRRSRRGPNPWHWGIVTQPLGRAALLHRRHRRDQAHALRHPRGRVGGHRLLRRVLGHALRHVLPRRVHRDCLSLGHHRHGVLRRLAGAVPPPRRLPPGRARPRDAARRGAGHADHRAGASRWCSSAGCS